MKNSTTSVTLRCAPETIWGAFFEPSYLDALYLVQLGYRAFSVLELADPSRKVRITPEMNLPGPVAKLIGDSFAFEEHATLDRDKNEWTWRMVQPANLDTTRKPRKDVVAMSGTVRIEEAGDGTCRRTDEFRVEAKIFGLGGLIESSIEKELRSARAKEYAFLEQWVVGRGS